LELGFEEIQLMISVIHVAITKLVVSMSWGGFSFGLEVRVGDIRGLIDVDDRGEVRFEIVIDGLLLAM
jgi:CYTH domain-containing protein